MSNLIPPLLSSSPPPIVGPLDEEEDDEFGDFRVATNSYDCDDFSLPPSPEKTLDKSDFSKVNLDINSNNSQKIKMPIEDDEENEVEKDFQDRRKSLEDLQSEPNKVEIDFSDKSTDNFFEEVHEDHNLRITETAEDGFSDFQTLVINLKVNDEELPEIETTDNTKFNDEPKSENNDLLNIVDVETVEGITEPSINSNNELKICKEEEIEIQNFKADQVEPNFEFNFEDFVNENKFEANFETSEGPSKISETDLKFSEGTDPKLSEEADLKLNEETDDEFGDFEEHFNIEFDQKPNAVSTKVDSETACNDEFGDFETSEMPEDDEFGDFNDFSTSNVENDEPVMLSIDSKNIFSKSEFILKEMYPEVGQETEDFDYIEDIKENVIFKNVQDITETNALIYQWSKSSSQKMFLKALNIDMRNILYGPAWNSSMPRFAANLSLAPLEPIKSEILTPTAIQNTSSPSNSSQKNSNNEIPSAQFDWNSSGLVNPLDSAPTEPLPEDKTDLFLSRTSEKTVSTPFEFEIQGRSNKESSDTISVSSLEMSKPSKDESEEKSTDFSPFNSPKMIPLRETHIVNENNELGWLQPTILTPDLPRKETPIVVKNSDDDEFDDFQMVLPQQNEPETKAEKVKNNSVLSDLSEFDLIGRNTFVNTDQNTHIVESSATNNSGPIQNDDDDEFTDFYSSVPVPQPVKNPQSVTSKSSNSVVSLEPLKPILPAKSLELLKPTISLELLKPTIQHNLMAAPTQINWPEPGVTDEDIKNIELTYSRKDLENNKQDIKQENSSNDDDEWSDFVSVTNPVKSVVHERTSTPDLPLSVLNLNQVQPPKQPIPVITHSGLIQTKLASRSSNVVQTTIQPTILKPVQMQPSIISNQFAKNSFQGTSNDDDDWSDFVSSQPLPQSQNGLTKQSVKPHVNWTNANIITNPHFDSYRVPHQQMQQRSTIPSISAMPDLDFIAPKNRTSRK